MVVNARVVSSTTNPPRRHLAKTRCRCLLGDFGLWEQQRDWSLIECWAGREDRDDWIAILFKDSSDLVRTSGRVRISE